MLVLAVDTSTPAVTAGLVELPPAGPPRLVDERVTVDAKAHAELLAPQVAELLRGAPADVDAIVCGAGPGPFTGLRVGMVTAAALGDGLGVPVHGVCSLDAIASAAIPADPAGAADGLLVATDARRREVYWASYRAGRRVSGPRVQRPADLAAQLGELGVTVAAGAGAAMYADVLGLPLVDPPYPTALGLVAVAAGVLRSGREPEPLVPLYLRRPDATEPGARKRVTAPDRGREPPTDDLEIGPLQKADLPRCAELERQLFHGDDPWRAEAFAAELDLGYFYLAARLGGTLVGYAGLALLGRPPYLEAEVHTIGVDPAHQRRGIGRRLLRELLAHADEHGAATYLEVRTDNTPAIELYRNEGFEVLGTRRRYYRPSGADAYTMRRTSPRPEPASTPAPDPAPAGRGQGPSRGQGKGGRR